MFSGLFAFEAWLDILAVSATSDNSSFFLFSIFAIFGLMISVLFLVWKVRISTWLALNYDYGFCFSCWCCTCICSLNVRNVFQYASIKSRFDSLNWLFCIFSKFWFNFMFGYCGTWFLKSRYCFNIFWFSCFSGETGSLVCYEVIFKSLWRGWGYFFATIGVGTLYFGWGFSNALFWSWQLISE